jgi:hypothetical protein
VEWVSAAALDVDSSEKPDDGIHLIPVLLGEGRRLFNDLGSEHTELELVRTLEAPGLVHLHYLVGRRG